MIVEILSNKEVSLNKWHKVHMLNGEHQRALYVRFARAWDEHGVIQEKIIADKSFLVDMYYNGDEYP